MEHLSAAFRMLSMDSFFEPKLAGVFDGVDVLAQQQTSHSLVAPQGYRCSNPDLGKSRGIQLLSTCLVARPDMGAKKIVLPMLWFYELPPHLYEGFLSSI